MQKIVRRGMTALMAAVALGLAACGGDDDEKAASAGATTSAVESVGKVSMGGQDQYSQLPIFVAEKHGFFEKHGVEEFEVVPFTSIPAMFAAVGRGQVDLAQVTPLAMHLYNQKSGSDFRYFVPVQNASLVWVGAPDTDIPVATDDDYESTIKAFKGKKIGVPALGGLVEVVTRRMAADAGLDPDKDFAVSALGTSQAAQAALKAGTVDVVAGDPFSAAVLTADNEGKVLINQSVGQGPDIFANTNQGSLFASAAKLQKDDGKYAAVAAALQDAREFLFDPANKEDVVSILTEKLEVTPAGAEALYEYVGPTFKTDLQRETWERTASALVETGLWPKPVPAFEDLVLEAGGGAS